MTKITLSDLANLENQTAAVNTINANNAILETALDNTLSRDGTSPNTMSSNLDMNSHQIYNLASPATVNSPARLVDVVTNPTITVPTVGTSGSTVGLLNTNLTFSGNNIFSGTSTFNGIPTAPTAAPGTNTTQIATTAYSYAIGILKANIASPTFTGTVTVPNITATNVTSTGSLTLAGAAASNIVQTISGGAASLVFNGTVLYGTDLALSLGTNSLRYSACYLGTAASTSTTTGALVVSGGVGIGGAAYHGGLLATTSPTAGLGYSTGAGGAVTQATNKSTAVTLNTMCGAITTNNAALAAATIVSFTVTCSGVVATDTIVLNHISGGTVGSYTLNAQAGAGSYVINIRNNTAGSLSEALVIQFAIIKAVNA